MRCVHHEPRAVRALLACRTSDLTVIRSIGTLMHAQDETCIEVMLMSMSNSDQLDQYERSLKVELEMRSKAVHRKLEMVNQERARRAGGGLTQTQHKLAGSHV